MARDELEADLDEARRRLRVAELALRTYAHRLEGGLVESVEQAAVIESLIAELEAATAEFAALSGRDPRRAGPVPGADPQRPPSGAGAEPPSR